MCRGYGGGKDGKAPSNQALITRGAITFPITARPAASPPVGKSLGVLRPIAWLSILLASQLLSEEYRRRCRALARLGTQRWFRGARKPESGGEDQCLVE